MDEYLSEKEQIERIREWWRENGWYLVGGVLLGVGGLFGYGRYQDYMAANAETAAQLYRELEAAAGDDNMSEVDRLLANLQADHGGSAYADQGALLAARLLLIRDTERATSELRGVMDSKDGELAMIARMRLARVLAYQQQYAESLALLEVAEPGAFSARIAEIRGDIFVASGDRDAARIAFTEALVAEGAELLDRNFVQMKLADLSGNAVAAVVEPSDVTEPDATVEDGDEAAPAQPESVETDSEPPQAAGSAEEDQG